MDNELKVWQYVLMYNEMRVLPFVVNYWRTYADKVIVYDSNSNDGSIEYLQSIKDIDIEIREDYQNDNKLDDENHKNLKNNIWKEARDNNVDFVIVSDMDEVLAFNGNIREELLKMKNDGETILHPRGYNLYSQIFPEYSNKLLHEYVKTVKYCDFWCKCILFNPNEIDEINYLPGGHVCNPTGNVKYYSGNKIILLHLHNLSLYYKLEHFQRGRMRLSENNIKNEWGIEYFDSEDKIISEFKSNMSQCTNIEDELS